MLELNESLKDIISGGDDNFKRLADEANTALWEKLDKKYAPSPEVAELRPGETSTDLTERIKSHLLENGQAGGAQLIDLDHKVELAIAESKKITSQEDVVILTPEARAEMLASANLLQHKLRAHFNEVRQEAIDQYVDTVELKNNPVSDTLKRFFKKGDKSGEQTLYFDEEMAERLEKSLALPFYTEDEAKTTVRRELMNLTAHNPERYGFTFSKNIMKRLENFTEELGGNNMSENKPINFMEFMHMKWALEDRSTMDELGIYPGFADSVEKSVQREVGIS